MENRFSPAQQQPIAQQFQPQKNPSGGTQKNPGPQQQVGAVKAQIACLYTAAVAFSGGKMTPPLAQKMPERAGKGHAGPAIRQQAELHRQPGTADLLQQQVVVAAQRGLDRAKSSHRLESRQCIGPVAAIGDDRPPVAHRSSGDHPTDQLFKYQELLPEVLRRIQLHQADQRGGIILKVTIEDREVRRGNPNVGVDKHQAGMAGMADRPGEGMLLRRHAGGSVPHFQYLQIGKLLPE